MYRAVALAVFCCLGSTAWASQGEGRITLSPGWRFTPNAAFYNSAQRAGFAIGPHSKGGPTGVATRIGGNEA